MIGKHWGTSSFLNGEPVVLRLGRIGSNVWEPAVPLLSQPIRTAKNGVAETFSIWGLCRCNYFPSFSFSTVAILALEIP